jgi:CRISPR/Cas system-associated protein Csm6
LIEKKNGREPIVNVTCGTKPVALAATLAEAMAKCNVIYFAAKEYRREGGEVVSKGVIEEPIVIGPLFELAELLLPKSEEERNVILKLLHKDKVKSITELLIEDNLKKKPSKSEIIKYSYYVNKLEKSKYVEIEGDEIMLTDLGKLIGLLLEKEIKVKSV